MLTVNLERSSYYSCVKRAIDICINGFLENPDQYLFEVNMSFSDMNGKVVRDRTVVRKEIISQYFGVELIQYKQSKRYILGPKTTLEYIELWAMIKENEPRKAENGGKRKRRCCGLFKRFKRKRADRG